MRARSASYFAASKGRFPFPHEIDPSLPGSLTKNRSFGERPVYSPVLTTSAPASVRCPSRRLKECSIRAEGLRSHQIASAFLIPWMERSADRLPFVLRNTVSSSAKAPPDASFRAGYSGHGRRFRCLAG